MGKQNSGIGFRALGFERSGFLCDFACRRTVGVMACIHQLDVPPDFTHFNYRRNQRLGFDHSWRSSKSWWLSAAPEQCW